VTQHQREGHESAKTVRSEIIELLNSIGRSRHHRRT
jgi:hypothetical protein